MIPIEHWLADLVLSLPTWVVQVHKVYIDGRWFWDCRWFSKEIV